MATAQGISEFSIEKVESYLDDFRVFASDCLFVRDHQTAQIVPFDLNAAQEILDAVVNKQLKELGFVRVITDKARREGVSTYIEGRFYWRTGCSRLFKGKES